MDAGGRRSGGPTAVCELSGREGVAQEERHLWGRPSLRLPMAALGSASSCCPPTQMLTRSLEDGPGDRQAQAQSPRQTGDCPHPPGLHLLPANTSKP